MLDPIAALAFSLYENKGVYALLLGSGLSSAAQIPTGWEITLDLVRRAALIQGIEDQDDWAGWYRKESGREPEYSSLLNVLAPTADERRSILHRYIEATPDDLEQNRKVPTKAHRAIAQLVKDEIVRVIITTNFDRLLENAIRDAGVEPTVIKSEDDLAGAVPLAHSRCYVVKLHGDYLDTRVRNTESELAGYSPQFNQLLDRIFDDYGVIVSGWSGEWDSALRSAIVRAPNRRYPFFWTGRGEPKPIAKDMLRQRAGRFIAIADADSFWTGLAAKVAVQIDLQRANPHSIKLLVATAKKYLASPDHRIELDDLIRDELNRALSLVAAESFQMSGFLDGAQLARRIGRHEAIFEPLANIFATLGRWGGTAEFQTAADVIASLADQETIGGTGELIALRRYPAMLLTYAYGLGSFRARQLARVHSLFRIPITDGNGKRGALVTRLFLDVWDGAGRDIWNRLPEFPEHNRKTPLSDHLHDLFQRWVGTDIFLPKEYTAAFEEFELMGGLIYLSIEADEQALDAMIADQMGDQWIWVPLGRIGWRGAGARPVLEKWSTAEGRRALIDAGFMAGSAELFGKALICLTKRMGRMSY
jgi:hypothetical protein